MHMLEDVDGLPVARVVLRCFACESDPGVSRRRHHDVLHTVPSHADTSYSLNINPPFHRDSSAIHYSGNCDSHSAGRQAPTAHDEHVQPGLVSWVYIRNDSVYHFMCGYNPGTYLRNSITDIDEFPKGAVEAQHGARLAQSAAVARRRARA